MKATLDYIDPKVKFVQFYYRQSLIKKVIHWFERRRAANILKQIESFLHTDDEILDIGSGSCYITQVLHEKKYKVKPLDVHNYSLVDKIKPIIYDGITIPFEDQRFDKSLVLTVLHHIHDPERVLREAMRVSKKIIIVEDIYSGVIGKHMTHFFDSLFNLEFTGHPHSNKMDREWKTLFKRLGLELMDARYFRLSGVFNNAAYLIKVQ